VFATEKGCGPSAVIPTVRGEFITTCYDNGTIGRISADGRVLSAYTHDKDGNRFVGPNDFAPDTHSGIYFTASGSQAPASMRRFSTSRPMARLRRWPSICTTRMDLRCRRGDLLYVVETDENRLVQFRIGADGTLSERRVFVNLDDLTAHGGTSARWRENRLAG